MPLDVLFELGDAILTAGPQPSLAHLSLAAPHRRGWGSLYAALHHGRPGEERLWALLARCAPDAGQPVYAVDVSVWPRCEAETSAARGYYSHPSRHLDGQPIVKGWAYQWIAQLGLERESWAAPVEVRRVLPQENAASGTAAQVKALRQRRPPTGTAPLFVFDAGYAVTALARALLDEPVALLLRLRADRCCYAAAPVAADPRNGRPRRNGAKFRCADPATWPTPTAAHTGEDAP